MYGVVYGLFDPRDGLLRYVGQTTRSLKKRLQEHLRIQNRTRATHLAHWVSLLWGLGFHPRIVELGVADSATALDELEVRMIAEHRAMGAKLTNHTEGGGGQKGRVVSEATRRKLSLAHKGRSAPHMKRPRATETRAKISASLQGRGVGEKNACFRQEVTVEVVIQGLAEGKTQAQLASELQVAHGTITSRLRQARERGIIIPKNYRAWNKGVQHGEV